MERNVYSTLGTHAIIILCRTFLIFYKSLKFFLVEMASYIRMCTKNMFQGVSVRAKVDPPTS